jgi:hypothetical protein
MALNRVVLPAPFSQSDARAACAIRPFGKKKDRAGREIDFDHVQTVLIEPALKEVGLGGGTTGEIVQAANTCERNRNQEYPTGCRTGAAIIAAHRAKIEPVDPRFTLALTKASIEAAE